MESIIRLPSPITLKPMVKPRFLIERSRGFWRKLCHLQGRIGLQSLMKLYGLTPFQLVYGKACHLPVELEHKAYWALRMLNFDPLSTGEKRKLELHALDELRLQAYESSKLYKEKVKSYHDKTILKREFRAGQSVLLFNSRLKLFPGKLRSKWSDPFRVKEVKPYGAIEIEDPKAQRSWVVNGQRSY
ncbi:uncharacterized protein LOC109816697 [Cajanus cajan]|uniref:uncharacterized protein LOC109816697 n=1 Tax=Cajanus cajan TaxID=3821 RepID=UPI00098D7805|nr:uncharacterized protein LOC109816697 [Cajanus cajan]